MRRSDRQVLNDEIIDGIMLDCDCCRLGFIDGSGVYIVPLNFGFAHEGGKRTLYFHGAREGRKAELISKRPHVGFEMDCSHALKPAQAACGFSFAYKSVIGEGDVRIIEDAQEKRRAFGLIMEHYSQKSDWTFPDETLDHTLLFALDITELACKNC